MLNYHLQITLRSDTNISVPQSVRTKIPWIIEKLSTICEVKTTSQQLKPYDLSVVTVNLQPWPKRLEFIVSIEVPAFIWSIVVARSDTFSRTVSPTPKTKIFKHFIYVFKDYFYAILGHRIFLVLVQ